MHRACNETRVGVTADEFRVRLCRGDDDLEIVYVGKRQMRCAGKRNASGTAKRAVHTRWIARIEMRREGKIGNHSHVREKRELRGRLRIIDFWLQPREMAASEEEKLGRNDCSRSRWRFVGGWCERNEHATSVLASERRSRSGGGYCCGSRCDWPRRRKEGRRAVFVRVTPYSRVLLKIWVQNA
jgi:hypothetical protein